MINSYNRIAPFYSLLSKLVYGNKLIEIQTSLFSELKTSGSVLVFGGGNGKILPHLFAHSPHFKVEYLDASDKMLTLAKKNNPFENINFIHTDEFPLNGNYDIIILPFVLDLMTKKQLIELCQSFSAIVEPDGVVLVSDFGQAKNIWQSFLLKTTIMFFRLFTSHPLHQLEDIRGILQDQGLSLLKTSTLDKGFLFSTLWKLN